MNYENKIAKLLSIQAHQARMAIKLLDEGNTIPFIARYRKEMTLNLDELKLRQVEETVKTLRSVDERRERIIESITEQGKLSPELNAQLLEAETLVELEDLYLPYRPKRMTRAMKAREAGLEPLANHIIQQASKDDVERVAKQFLTDDIASIEQALEGARDIVAEVIADDADIRHQLREKAWEWGTLLSQKIKSAEDEKSTFKTYYDFSMRVKWVKPYQTLAINRGEAEKVLRVKVDIPERDWLGIIERKFRQNPRSEWASHLQMAIQDSAKRLLLPAIERDVRRQLTDEANRHAIDVFSKNLRNLLLQPPLLGHVVLGIDPGYRTGSKVAVIDETGRVLDTTTIYPHAPQGRFDEAKATLNQYIRKFNVTLIVIGNGTASRETELLAAEIVRESEDLSYLIVNEAGASVYSASDVARREFPDMDVTLRGAVSIARRAQDPLAELVKIDPKSIGVGLYQHDVNQTELSDSLTYVVQSVVNQVGVDLNTSSGALLKYVSGVSESIANAIVDYRDAHGKIDNRHQLRDVKGIGNKTFEQAAGFLRIRDGEEWFDSSAIHPESYDVARKIVARAEIRRGDNSAERKRAIDGLLLTTTIEDLAEELHTGVPTLIDLIEQLQQPGRDPREDIQPPVLRRDVMKMEDLSVGMVLQGTVRNVVDFGAFVDIGVKQDGLLHKSKIPRDTEIELGNIIPVVIESIDVDRGRIGLSLGTE